MQPAPPVLVEAFQATVMLLLVWPVERRFPGTLGTAAQLLLWARVRTEMAPLWPERLLALSRERTV